MEGKSTLRIQKKDLEKFHISIHPKTGEILTVQLTDNSNADAHLAETILKYMPKSVKRVIGDKAYDRFRFRRCVHEHGATNGTPQSKNATVHFHSLEASVQDRNEAIIEIAGLGGDELAR